AAYGYTSILVFDPRGRILGRSRGTAEPDADTSGMVLAVAQSRTFQADLAEDGPGRRVLTITVPVFSEPGVASTPGQGVIVLRLKPEAGLYRLLAEETSPQTDETLLFRLESGRPT